MRSGAGQSGRPLYEKWPEAFEIHLYISSGPLTRLHVRFIVIVCFSGGPSGLLMGTEIRFTLNGRPRTVNTDPSRPLLEVLREDLQLAGSKFGCGEGQCRACTVMIDGQSTPSCITRVGDIGDRSVVTIEGLAGGGELHPVQKAFLDEGAFQCGYCTPGMIMGVTAVMRKNPKATEAEVLSELERHICRCCSYAGYRRAVHRVLTMTPAEKARL